MLKAVKINGSNPPMKSPMMTFGSGQRELEHRTVRPLLVMVRLQFFDVRAEQDQRRQPGRSDGVAFCHRFHGVADRIQFIGDAANFLRQDCS